jgi:hypothetical protein
MKESDLEIIINILRPFFRQARIYNALKIIGREDISGFEKWLEIELLIYLSEQKDYERNSQWNLEMDKRKSSKNHKLLDIGIRKKGHKKNKYIGIELKCNNNMDACINGMIKDCIKLTQLKGSANKKTRSLFFVGIHPKEDVNLIRKTINKYLYKQYGDSPVKSDYQLLKNYSITYTNYSYSII